MQRFIETHTNEEFDVIVIGGGITGASVAYEAASRGLTVALVEKNDISWATSSATSKMIHGGLRYLVGGEFGLVRESLRERCVLENIAPNFVYPWPIMATHSHTPFNNRKRVVKIGMLLYDVLSYDKNCTWDKSKQIPRHRTISKKAVLDAEPNVRPDGLTGASIFYDCVSIFPERLTLAFIKSAYAHGAKVANHARVEGFIVDKRRRVNGVEVRDTLSDTLHTVRGRVTINCGGPWADIVLGLAKPQGKTTTLKRSEGIHIITAKPLISGKFSVGAATAKGRYLLIPWRGHTLIGTTDKPYTGDPDTYRVTKQSIMELIDTVNGSFGDGKLCYGDVKHAYGGLRPLVEDQTEETYSTSRRYEINDNADDGLEGLITVEGGKYTTSRNLAETCLKLVERKIGRKLAPSETKRRYLSGCSIPDLNAFMYAIQRDNKDFSGATLDYLGRTYGTEHAEILQLARQDKSLAESVNADGEILAQVAYAVRREMARTLSDILMRRTGMGTLGNPGTEIIYKVAEVAAKELGWDAMRLEKELNAMIALLTVPQD